MCYDAPGISSNAAQGEAEAMNVGNWQMSGGMSDFKRGQALQDQYAGMFGRIAGAAEGESGANSRFAANQRDQYEQVFNPVTKQFAADAMNYDSPAEMARREGMAAGTVQGQFDAAQGMADRRLASYGVSPSSGRTVQGTVNNANALALAKAGAVNQERSNSKVQGIQLRGQAAQLGQGVASNALQSSGLSTQQGATAGNIAGANASFNNAAGAGARDWMSGANSSFRTGADIALGRAGEQSRQNKGESDSLGSTIGTVAGIAGLFLSSKKAKKNVKSVDDDEALDAMRKVPVKQWDYKQGKGDGGSHVGPMAEDMQRAAGDGVAPGGKGIDLISANGMTMAAVRALDRRVSALQRSVKRDREEDASENESGDQFARMEPIPL